MSAKPEFNVFISHIHEERRIAGVLKQWFEALFPAHLAAFVSSDYDDIPLGSKWLSEIEAAMGRSLLLVSLVSPTSFARMWIHLEVGWALGRTIDVLPICHGGAVAAELTRPYSDFNGVNVEDAEFGKRLVASLKTRLKMQHSVPDKIYEGFTAEVRTACEQNRKDSAAFLVQRPTRATTVSEFQPDEAEMSILRFLISVHNGGARSADYDVTDAV